MALNISKGNMYKFITHTLNPIGGKCYHACSYCSTNKLMRYPVIQKKYSGKATLIKKELEIDLKCDNFIFVVAQNDLFAQNIKEDWIFKIFDFLKKYDNSYLFQSKNTKQMANFVNFMPPKSVVCTTIETNRHYPKIMQNAPTPRERAEGMNMICDLKKYVTIEPIMDFDMPEMVEFIKMCNATQVNIGADSGNNNLPEPNKQKILQLITELETFTIVEKKKNLKRLIV